MAYDISALTPKEQITALYVAYYDRAPDPGGLAFWTGQLEEFLDGAGDGQPGMSLNAIANSFANAQESKDLYPFLDGQGSSGAFLTNVYINLFGRLPDTEGRGALLNALSAEHTHVVLVEDNGGTPGSPTLRVLSRPFTDNDLEGAISPRGAASARFRRPQAPRRRSARSGSG